MRAHVQITLAYLVLCHILLYGTSPSYKHELRRLGDVALDGVYKLSFGYTGKERTTSWRMQPKSGLYRSTELLKSVQQGMAFNVTTGLYAAKDLVAYTSATDAIKGQGWKARAALFVQLMAPRYTLLPFVHPSLKPQLQLFSLAAADLPAVGLLAGSEDPRVGFRLLCSSPAMHFSLGPQPIANCSVWSVVKQPAAATAEMVDSSSKASCKQEHASSAAVNHNVCSTCSAGLGLYKNAQSACMRYPGSSSSSSSSSEDAGTIGSTSNVSDGSVAGAASEGASQQQQTEKPLAFWTIVPTSFDNTIQPTAIAAAAAAGVEGRAAAPDDEQDVISPGIDQRELPLLGGPSYYEPPPGGLLSMMAACDAWFIFPRTALVRLLPAMTGLQQLVFAHAVASYTFLDLLHIITAMQVLHTQMRAQDPFMARGRALGTAACTVAGQLLVMLVVRLVVSTLLAFGAVMLLHQLLRGVKFAAVMLQLPTLRWLAFTMKLSRWLFGGSAAAAAAGSSVSAAASSAGAHAGAAAAAATEASSNLWSFALSDAAATAATKAAAGLAADAAGTGAAADVLRRWLLPWHRHLSAMHDLCEDLVLLTGARLVWELQDILSDVVWNLLSKAAWEVQVLMESAAAMTAMLVQGSSWGAAWARFSQLQQMQQQRRAEAAAARGRNGDHNRVQAQVFIQAPADMGQAAEALRNLADELEHLGMRPLGLFAGGTRPVPQVLGQHWPAPLQLPFDAEDIQVELGVEVPRGFICPITQDIMSLPALLISSSVAVPATYDRDAIARWLQDNRRDPKSRQVLAADAQLVPNMDLYRAIEDWVAEKQALRNQQAAAAAQDEVAALVRWDSQAGEEQAAATAAAAAPSPPPTRSQLRPNNSAGAVCSDVIAAAVRGVAAAMRQTRSTSLGHAARHAPAAAAAAAQDADVGALLSDEEVEGPVAAIPTSRTAAEGRGMQGPMQQQRREQHGPIAADAGAELAVAVHAAGITDRGFDQQQQRQQMDDALSGVQRRRYHLRSSRQAASAQ